MSTDRAGATVAISGVVGGVAGLVLAIMLVSAPVGVLETSGCGQSTLVRDAGFDPWTGQPQGRIVRGWCVNGEHVIESPIPNELLGKTGIPWATLLVVALVLGGLVVGWGISRLNRDSS